MKRKLEEVSSEMNHRANKILKYNCEENLLLEKSEFETDNNNFQTLLLGLKNKFSSTISRADKIQILTMFVGNFKKSSITEFYEVGIKLINRAEEVKQIEGILVRPRVYRERLICDLILV